MSDVIPEQGLGPQNQKWRQWVERKITSLQKNLEQKLGADVNNSLKSANSSMGLLSRQVQELSAQSDYLSGLKTLAVSGPVMSYDDVAGDNVAHYFDTGLALTLKVPTGRAVVTTSATMILVNPGNAGAEGFVTFAVAPSGGGPNVVNPNFSRSTRVWSWQSFIAVGGSSDHVISVPDPEQDYEFKLFVGYSSGSTSTLADIRVDFPRLIVQVIDPA